MKNKVNVSYQKHLTLPEREDIERLLKLNYKFCQISEHIHKDATTVSKEIKKYRTEYFPSKFNTKNNFCKLKRSCTLKNLCSSNCNSECSKCEKCNTVCEKFEKDICEKLLKPPYVCNGCETYTQCRKIKYIYNASEAHKKYETTLVSSRIGVNISERELEKLDNLVSPLIKKGQSTRALQLANFADYYIIKKLGINTVKKVKYPMYNNWIYSWDYFTYNSAMFQLADSLPANELVEYLRQCRKSKTKLDYLLASGSNMNTTFWHDIIGTHYLREYKYKKAIMWLKTLPKNYERNTNIYREDKDYLMRDPFDMSLNDPKYRRKRLNTTLNYKLNYAMRMAKYEETMTNSKTKEERAIAKLHYAIGKRNQHDYCWALTSYVHWSGYPYVYDFETHEEVVEKEYSIITTETNKMISEALNDMSKSSKAKYLHAMNRNKEVMDECPETETAQYLRLVCDTWKNYVKQ